MVNLGTLEKSQKDTIFFVLFFQDMVNAKGELKLLYVTPEKLSKSKRFMAKLQKSYSLGLFNRLAIDEVHCCSVCTVVFLLKYQVFNL